MPPMPEMEAETEVPRDAPGVSVQIEGRGPLSPDTLTLWSEAHCFPTPDGAILTLVHTIPIFNGDGELIALEKKPFVHYSMSHNTLARSAELLIEQAIAGAAQFGGSGAQEEVEAHLAKAIADGRSRAEDIKRQLVEIEENNDAQ